MDYGPGRVPSGDVTLTQAAQELQELVVAVAGGQPSKPEALGHQEYFIMYKHQDTPPLDAGCRA